VSDHVDELAVEPVNRTKQTTTELHRMLRDRIKYRLQLSWRATNNRKNIARCSLLFQSLGELTVTILQFFRQAHVLTDRRALLLQRFRELLA